MTLNSVVNSLIRAAAAIPQDISDTDLDRHVAKLLAEEAKAKEKSWRELGLGAYLDRSSDSLSDYVSRMIPDGRPDPNAPKPNKRFLASIIRNVDGHNAAVIRQQAQAAADARAERRGETSRSGAASRLFGGAMRGLREDRDRDRGRGRDERDRDRRTRREDDSHTRSREHRVRDQERGEPTRDRWYQRDRSPRERRERREGSQREDADRRSRHRTHHEDRSHRERSASRERTRSDRRHRRDDKDDDEPHRRRTGDRSRSPDRPRRPHKSPTPTPPPFPPPPPDDPPPPVPEGSPSPPPLPSPISRMDRYFKQDYDPRLDYGEVPSQGLVTDVGWDNMLAVLKERGQKRRIQSPGLSDDGLAVPSRRVAHGKTAAELKAEKADKAERKRRKEERRKRRGDSDESEEERQKRKDAKRKEALDPMPPAEPGLFDMEYTKKGGMRAWDVGKEDM